MILFNFLIALAVGAVLGIIDTVVSFRRWTRFKNRELGRAYEKGVERGRALERAEVREEFREHFEDK